MQPFYFHLEDCRIWKKSSFETYVNMDDLLAKGIMRANDSEYASPVILVPKKNGEFWFLCLDYQTLNKYIVRNNYPIPVIEDQLNVLKNKKYFTILDLKDGYHIRMAEESIPYTTFIMPFG